MDILFIHPNFPGQFLRLAAALAQDPAHRVFALGDESQINNAAVPPGVQVMRYPAIPDTPKDTHPLVRIFERSVRRGEQAVNVLAQAKKQGFEPDVVLIHTGWGDAYFVRDFFPGARVIGLFEYYYRVRGADLGYDPEFPTKINDIFRLHVLNAAHLLALESCDSGICATAWQKKQFPSAYQPNLEVLHEGIDTALAAPDPEASLTLADGTHLRAGDEVLTYVSRSLEPYRGFHVFMRALPYILKSRPNCQVVIVGAQEGVSYGVLPEGGGQWKDKCIQELPPGTDLSRVHFTGHLGYADYFKLLKVSRCHVYFTMPFVLSWSLLEAMSSGCTIVASATAPVQEVMDDGQHGLLCDFKDHAGLASKAISVLSNPEAYRHLGRNARARMVAEYDFQTVTLPRYRALMGL